MWLLDAALSDWLHQHIPSSLTFLGSGYIADRSVDGESLGLSPIHLTTHNTFHLRLSWVTQAPPWPFGSPCLAPNDWLET